MKSRSITLVSHCWSPPGCDLYAQHLKWQIASLISYPPQCNIDYVVCIAPADKDNATWCVIESFWNKGYTVAFDILVLDLPQLLRRAIGRNMVAKRCESDIVYYVDADYAWGPGCLDTLADQVGPDDQLCSPATVLQNIDHETGDRMVNEARDTLLPWIDPSLFRPRGRRLAIGGLQIVGGNHARQHGYLDGTKWTQPVDASKGWHQTDEDMRFRKQFEGVPTKFIELPNLYWIRHKARVGNNYEGATSGKDN